MLKGKFAVLSLAAAGLLCLQIAGVNTVNSGIVDPCNSTASAAAGAIVACPQGDGTTLASVGSTISVTVKDNTNAPVPGVPAADFWLIGCSNGLVLCGGSASIDATAATDLLGQTTINGDIAAGGCDAGVKVVVQGIVIGGGACPVICLAITVRSPDLIIDAGNIVTSNDFAKFGTLYPYPGVSAGGNVHVYGPGICAVIVGGGAPPAADVNSAKVDYVSPFLAVNLADFAFFGSHYTHKC